MRKVRTPGRGTQENPPNRFDAVELVRDGWIDPDDPAPHTRFLRDASRSLITYNQSPDVGFDASLNPYRGCEHGCIYCYARPFHEYLGFSAGLDFETRIMVKEDAPALLRAELRSPRWKPQVLGLSGVTDPYQPIERRLQLTRRCLEILEEFRNPVCVITKNHLVARDADLLAGLASHRAALVNLSITTLDPELHRVMEPRTSIPALRLDAVRELVGRGIPVGVLVAPVVPGLTDHEIPRLVAAAADAGASWVSYVMLRLPGAVSSLFEAWLEQHFPDRKARILNRIRDVRGGNLTDARFGSRMVGEGTYAQHIRDLFRVARRKAGLQRKDELSTAAFRRPPMTENLPLFDPGP